MGISVYTMKQKPMKDTRYKFQQVNVRFKWTDYERLRSAFKAQRGETAVSYFGRLALWLKQGKAYFLDDVPVNREEWEKWWMEAQLE